MEAIVIHPDGAEQLKIVKAVLKALNVRFEKQAPLPPILLPALKKDLRNMKMATLFD